MKQHSFSVLALIAFSLCPLAAHGAPGALTDFGTLNNGASSYAYGINSDGSVVVGQAFDGQANINCAFRWAQAEGMVSLGTLPGGVSSQANGVNSDGSVVVGQSYDGVANANRAFRWTQAGGMVNLGMLPGSTASQAYGVNSDGNVVVGHTYNAGNAGNHQAFRWTPAGGMVNLGTLPGGAAAIAYGVNNDGSVVVGQSTADGGDSNKAFRWTSAGGMVSLGTLPGGVSSTANGVNSDGSVVVGRAVDGFNFIRAFRWTQASGMVNLGTLPGGHDSQANGANNDGSVVVGSVMDEHYRSHAFRWTQTGGLQTVDDWLRANGVIVPADITSEAKAVNVDGSIVVGQLANQHAFIARVSTTGSGLITLADLQQSLLSITPIPTAAMQITSTILHGANGNPLSKLLENEQKTGMWIGGDWGKMASQSEGGLAEVGAAYRLLPGLQAQLGLGKTRERQALALGGRASSTGQYVVAELINHLPIKNLFVIVSAIHHWSDFNISRGYINAGNPDSSKAKTRAKSPAFRARLEWKEGIQARALRLSPYAELSAQYTHVKGYTENGGGFPARFNGVSIATRNARLGIKSRLPINHDKTSIVASVEGIHSFYQKQTHARGQVLGLFAFDLASPISTHRTWVRGSLGMDHKVGPGTVSLAVNATTKGQEAPFWLAAFYRWAF